MKVCDVHIDRRAVDTLCLQTDDTFVDVCDECKYAILALISKPPESDASPVAPPPGDAQPKAPKRGLRFLRNK